MELWIRSQNKEMLVNVDMLCVEEGKEIIGLENGYDIVDDKRRYGRYATKERALEILEKIENKMAYINDKYVTGHNNLMIFEMPKE